MGDENLSERRLTVLLGTAAHRILTLAEHQEALSIAEQLATRVGELQGAAYLNGIERDEAQEKLRDAEARVKELVERRNRLIQEKYDAEARCERMREALERLCQDPDLVGSPAAWLRCAENPNRTKPPCRACAALDTDTTAGEQG